MAEQQAIAASTELSARSAQEARLRKHADYQRVYQASRKHFSPSMSYFYALRSAGASSEDATASPAARPSPSGSRVGLTAGRVLGKAVDRNRIKRRMREAVRKNIHQLTSDVDLILHPRKFVITLEYSKLETEVGRIFATVQSALDRQMKDREIKDHQTNDRQTKDHQVKNHQAKDRQLKTSEQNQSQREQS